MPESTINEADLQAFLEMAGRSLSGAQGELSTGVDLRSDIVLANAELEAKIALKTSADGRLSVEPISSLDLVKSTINAAGISTLRVNFVATAAETSPGIAFQSPTRTASDVAQDVRNRPDVAALESILGALHIETTYEPRTRRWLVTALDPRGRVVRETIVPDEMK